MSQQRKFFPGWLVVASGFVIMATCYTIFVNCMSLFQPLIVSDLGISLAQYTISNAHDRRVQAVWHGRPRQGHGHHYLARDGRRHRRRYRLGRAVRCHGLLCEHLDRVPGVFCGHARIPAGLGAYRRQAARKRGGGVDVRRSFCSPRSARGCLGSRMEARTIIRFPRQLRAYEMIPFPPSSRDHVT